MHLNEQAMKRSDAMHICMDLGEQFTKHFHKIYNETNNATKLHHAAEMQAWLDRVDSINLKDNNRYLSLQKKMDWFFTVESDAITLFHTEDEANSYDDFIDDLVGTNDVKLSLYRIGLLNCII